MRAKRMSQEDVEMYLATDHPGQFYVRDLRAVQKELRAALASEQRLRNALQVLADAEADRRLDGLGDVWQTIIRRMVDSALATSKGATEAGQ